jgi:hypothetical protein
VCWVQGSAKGSGVAKARQGVCGITTAQWWREGEFWLTDSGATPCFFGCVANTRVISPLFVDVWQGKELRGRFSDVWQGKDLGDLGQKLGERGARRGLLENNIHYYNMDVNRDCGAVRTVRMGRVRGAQ